MGVFSLTWAVELLKKKMKLGTRLNFPALSPKREVVINGMDQRIKLDQNGFRSRKINCIVLDETVIGDCISGRILDSNKLRDKYILPFQRKGIYLIAVMGSDEPRVWSDCANEREFLKLKKNVLKAYNNQPDHIKKEEIKMLMEQKNDCFKNITKENILEECAYYHWLEHSTEKRITKAMKRMTENLFKRHGVPVMIAPGEADQWCAIIQKIGLADLVLSSDSDMIAMGCDTIVGVDEEKDEIDIIFHHDFLEHFISQGYTKDQIQQALCLSSADFNFIIYDKELPFPKALSLIKSCGNIFNAMQYLCRRYDRVYDQAIVGSISRCYELSYDGLDSIFSLLSWQIDNREEMLTRFQDKLTISELNRQKDISRFIISVFRRYMELDQCRRKKVFFELHYQMLSAG